jgi:hypothetical protein
MKSCTGGYVMSAAFRWDRGSYCDQFYAKSEGNVVSDRRIDMGTKYFVCGQKVDKQSTIRNHEYGFRQAMATDCNTRDHLYNQGSKTMLSCIKIQSLFI